MQVIAVQTGLVSILHQKGEAESGWLPACCFNSTNFMEQGRGNWCLLWNKEMSLTEQTEGP